MLAKKLTKSTRYMGVTRQNCELEETRFCRVTFFSNLLDI